MTDLATIKALAEAWKNSANGRGELTAPAVLARAVLAMLPVVEAADAALDGIAWDNTGFNVLADALASLHAALGSDGDV